MEFRYDLADLKFIINEWLPAGEVFCLDRFRDKFTGDDVDLLLNEAYRIAREVVHPLNAPGDKAGISFEKGVVRPAPGYGETYRFLQRNGWGSTSECIELDSGMPLILYKMVHELNQAACPALASYLKLTSGVVNLILRFGTDEDKARFLPNLLNGNWQGTMCLTEPQAGSDVGDIISRAYPTEDPRVYRICGTKMFITGGDAGICENTIHMVLARPEGGAPGTAGLGLYLVPRIRLTAEGGLGEDNDITTLSLEHKMGLHAQATALLNFGENGRCLGIRMGPEPDKQGRSPGLNMMFHMMNESRIGTGHNANSQAAAAYFYAAQYARERIQGRPFGLKEGERLPIIRHEDVKRMLLDMKAHTEGIRAMIFKGFFYLDCEANSPDPKAAKSAGAMAAILTPLIKCYASEASLRIIAQAIQVLGGVGYSTEYPVEQYLRDSKILTVWEGTSFIHGLDLVTRKMRMEGGDPFRNWVNLIGGFIESKRDAPGFAREMDNLARGYDCLRELVDIYEGWYAQFKAKRELIPLHAVSALFISARLQTAQCLMEQALLARRRLEEVEPGLSDGVFYQGKIAAARYYLNQILPKVSIEIEPLRREDRDALDLPEEALGAL